VNRKHKDAGFPQVALSRTQIFSALLSGEHKRFWHIGNRVQCFHLPLSRSLQAMEFVDWVFTGFCQVRYTVQSQLSLCGLSRKCTKQFGSFTCFVFRRSRCVLPLVNLRYVVTGALHQSSRCRHVTIPRASSHQDQPLRQLSVYWPSHPTASRSSTSSFSPLRGEGTTAIGCPINRMTNRGVDWGLASAGCLFALPQTANSWIIVIVLSVCVRACVSLCTNGV